MQQGTKKGELLKQETGASKYEVWNADNVEVQGTDVVLYYAKTNTSIAG